ncbi:hypothetical protein ABXT47_04520 [Candidatus Pelagibacter sp. Uisw_099_02]|uniref:hypothetical protein n=1 Tax=Candidatus Pelagibacter sp. Uisw_099_02 TaxID=3230981 RepID=UPI0039E75750
MKKVLCMIILAIILQNCASSTTSRNTQADLVKKGEIKLGMNPYDVEDYVGGLMSKYVHRWVAENSYGKELVTYESIDRDNVIYLFQEEDPEKQFKFWGSAGYGDYELIKIFNNYLDYYVFVSELPRLSSKDKSTYTTLKNSQLRQKEKNIPKEEKEKIEMVEIIEKSKNTCKSLGFEEGTEKFVDCSLKLYSQEVDNRIALKVAEQKSSTSSNTGSMVIYDPVRDRQNQIDRGMKMLGGKCTLGIDC